MRDGEVTRQRIVEQTASLLNKAGYLRASMNDIMRATGLTKGAIYHHFANRDDLVLETFQYAVGRVRERMIEALSRSTTAKERLLGLIGVFRSFPHDEVLRGGCPIINLAIEYNDVHPRLRTATQQTMDALVGRFEDVITSGIESGEFAACDARVRANHVLAALEGALMMSNVYEDYSYLDSVAGYLEDRVNAGLP